MSSYNIQKLIDGSRNVVFRLAGEIDSAGDIAPATLVDITTLSPKPASVRIERLKWSVVPGSTMDIAIWWQATSNELVWAMGTGDDADFSQFGGITNNAPAGFTGNILFSTTGYGATGPTNAIGFAMIIELVKQRVDFER